MANAYLDIQAALDGHLASYQSTDVAWENTGYEPQNDTAYLEPSLMLGEPSAAALGSNAKNRQVGVYQIGVHHPIGGGSGDAVSQADEIVTHFKRATLLTQNGVTVRISASWRTKAVPSANFYTIPVSVRFWADTPNT